ncbi:class I SAM-dependent methyltransferase [Clostridium sp. B9]|uniref:class I SAM-dependent methyltransferase n=1 Tax=Clostridium sp. B9 TaxID=3423224 RepID=UPI003D2E9E68
MDHKFNIEHIEKLNSPKRLTLIDWVEVLKVLSLPDKPVIADIGAGTGLFSRVLLEKLPNSTVYSLDISDDMLEYMNTNLAPSYPKRLTVGKMQESHIPLKDNSVDLVIMINIQHELAEPSELLKDAYRVLKEDAKIFIADFKVGEHKHAISKESIISDLKEAAFSPVEEIIASNELICLIGES